MSNYLARTEVASMDYKQMLDSFMQIACVLSVDMSNPEDSDSYVILDANDAYMASVGRDRSNFKVNVPYTDYIRIDKNFEMMCESCVKTGQPVHAYVDAAFYNSWMDIYMLPVKSDKEGFCNCLFSYHMTPKADANKLADISSDTAAQVLKICIKLRGNNDFQKAMDAIIADLLEICDANHCTILLTDFENKSCSVLCDAFKENVNEMPMVNYMGDNFFDIVETWPLLIDGSNCCIINDEGDMDRVASISPKWGASLRGANVKTLVIYPLKSENDVIGYIWATNFDNSRTMQIKEILEITTFILSAEIANHQMIRKMKILSSTDLLTGVLNRNAMNNRILDNDSGVAPIKEPFGVFFVDVNGLKSTNDTQGHIAGDNLLRDVASTLSEHFKDQEVYRVGGDEFMVISEGIPQTEFTELKEKLNNDCERTGRAHYAFGASYSDETHNIKRSMQLADVRMYENKEEYYKRHPEYVWDRRVLREE